MASRDMPQDVAVELSGEWVCRACCRAVSSGSACFHGLLCRRYHRDLILSRRCACPWQPEEERSREEVTDG